MDKYVYIYIRRDWWEVDISENDIPAKKTFQSESSWIPCENEHQRWKKGSCSKKSKRKKSIISVGRIYVAFSSIIKEPAHFVQVLCMAV